MPDQTDHRLQAAHALINELVNTKLELIAHVMGLDERNRVNEARVAELEERLSASPVAPDAQVKDQPTLPE